MGAGVGLLSQGVGNMMQVGQNQQLMQQQIAGQMQMGQFNSDLAYKQWLRTNYDAQRKQMEKAGLNVGLMYGGGGAGGGTATATPGSVSSSSASSESGINNGMAMMLQAGLQQAQIENIKADTAKKVAETKTTDDSRSTLVENMRQVGISTLTDNKLKAWLMSDQNVRGSNDYNDKYDYHVGVGEESNYAKQISSALLKTASETDANLANIDLTNQKVQGYWQELLNETKKADASGVQAAAVKLASEWTTGEYTNWKTWVDVAKNAIDSVGKIVK